MTATTEQWMHFYDQQPLMDGPAAPAPPTEAFSDATVVATTSPTALSLSSEGILSPSSSYTTSGHLTPKGNVSKPIRRRSRASNRTPTTLLNANTTNFRALVQQFTGCPSTAMSVGVHRGPITLNFQQGGQQRILQHDTATIMPPFGNRSYSQVHQVAVPLPWQKQPEQVPQQQLFQGQQSGYSFDYARSSTSFLPTSGNSRPTTMEVSHGLLMDNDLSLHELTRNAFSNDNKNNDGYFI